MKRISITTRTSSTTWVGPRGVRHHALIQPCYSPASFADVFTPCLGYIAQVNASTADRLGVVTCLPCLTARFPTRVKGMNLDAIKHLDEADLLADFIDQDAMAINFRTP